jgi:hypothetical protein
MKTEADIRNFIFFTHVECALKMFTHAKCALQNVLHKKLFTHGERALKNGFSHAEHKN